jgi:hypothetical protein
VSARERERERYFDPENVTISTKKKKKVLKQIKSK